MYFPYCAIKLNETGHSFDKNICRRYNENSDLKLKDGFLIIMNSCYKCVYRTKREGTTLTKSKAGVKVVKAQLQKSARAARGRGAAPGLSFLLLLFDF